MRIAVTLAASLRAPSPPICRSSRRRNSNSSSTKTAKALGLNVLLHELAHGLGFLTIVDLASGAKAGGFNDTFMLNLENHLAMPRDYPSMPDAQRVAASTATGNLHWVGANVEAASGVLTAGKVGNHVQMFAPNPQQPTSSVVHWDTALAPDQLLEPIYTGPNHNPVLELPLFQDIGWTLLTGPALQVTPTTNIVASGPQGGPFSPSSFSYALGATSESVNYAISDIPDWLTASATSGTASSSGTTVTFTVNAFANGLTAGTYPATITFSNADTGQASKLGRQRLLSTRVGSKSAPRPTLPHRGSRAGHSCHHRSAIHLAP
jgi:hypothetical protein